MALQDAESGRIITETLCKTVRDEETLCAGDESVSSVEEAQGWPDRNLNAGKRCFIVGAGSFQGMCIRPRPGDLVIAADGGLEHLKGEGIQPDVLLGDFDSLPNVPEHKHLIRHSPIKDDTDMALAAKYGQEQGCNRFYLYGGLGGRLDHSLANIQLLAGLSHKGCEAYLIGEGVILTAITGERLSFGAANQGILSVFCMGDRALGVTEQGLKYSLEEAVLTGDRALGVSNEFIGEDSYIEVRQGTLLILWDAADALPSRRERCR